VGFDVGRYMNWFDIFEVTESGPCAPIQKLADRMTIRNPAVLVSDWDGKEPEETLGGLTPQGN
jgi:hypothetical protein